MDDNQRKSLELAMKQIDKTFGKGTLIRLGDKTIVPVETVSTGSLGLDLALGVGGLPKGRVVEIYGPESSGKTTLTLHSIAECQKAGGVCVFIDAEHALDIGYAKKIGVDVENLLVSQPECVNIDEFILTDTGYRKFGELIEDDVIFSLNDEKGLQKNQAKELLYSNKNSFLLRTSAFELECSDEHKIKTFLGYKKLKELSLSDKVEYLYKHNLYSNENKTDLTPELSFILGSFLADGNYNGSNPRFFNIDEDYLTMLNGFITKHFPDTTFIQDNITFRYKKRDNSNHNHSVCSLKEFLNKYLGSVSGQDKYIPKEIFNSGKENIKAFLSGYFLADGSVSKKGIISISSFVKSNILNISSLFSFLGIQNTIKRKVKENKYICYELTINSVEGYRFFKDEMMLIGYKKDRIINNENKKSFLRFPKELWDVIFSEAKIKFGTIVNFYNILKNENSDSHHFNSKRGLTNEYVIYLNSVLKSKIIQEFIDSDIAYSNILEIADLNKKVEMLDISVPGTNNFVINNMVVHNCGEQALEILDTVIRSGAVDLVVVDSVAALTPKVEIDGDMDDQQVGVQARLMSKALRKITGTLHKMNCTVIFINQIRMKIGMTGYGSPETTTGGNALKFYSSVRLDIRRISTLKQGENSVGNRVKVKVVKNKVAAPFKVAEFDIMFGEGISKTGEIIDYGIKFDVIDKAGSWLSYNDMKLGQGKENAKKLLDENPTLKKEIELKVVEKLTPDVFMTDLEDTSVGEDD